MLNRNKNLAGQQGEAATSGVEAVSAEPATENAEITRLKARIAELELLVGSDTLTPLFNRRHFMELLERWCWRAQRYGGKAGLLYIDVDNLKDVNDNYGHQVGDEMLIAIAKGLTSSVRKSDVIARIGGDEFAILLESFDTANLQEKIGEIKRRVSGIKVSAEKVRLHPTVSIGAIPIHAGDRPNALLRAADKAMYADKRASQRSDK